MTEESISKNEIDFIIEANKFLENPSILTKLIDKIGKPIEFVHSSLPESSRQMLAKAVDSSLKSALKVAIGSISSEKKTTLDLDKMNGGAKNTKWLHTASVTATGAIGGFFGALSLPIELPISTGIMLRGISRVASEWGHDLGDPTVQMQCLYIFTLGSKKSKSDDELDSAYLGSRVAFANLIRMSAKYIVQHGAKEVLQAIEKGSAPILIRFVAQVAAFFELALTEKLIAEAVPFVGALGGAAINAAFCQYFVDAARYHFGLVHLEDKYGAEHIQKIYIEARKSSKEPATQVS